jgi:hypothetical protein
MVEEAPMMLMRWCVVSLQFITPIPLLKVHEFTCNTRNGFTNLWGLSKGTGMECPIPKSWENGKKAFKIFYLEMNGRRLQGWKETCSSWCCSATLAAASVCSLSERFEHQRKSSVRVLLQHPPPTLDSRSPSSQIRSSKLDMQHKGRKMRVLGFKIVSKGDNPKIINLTLFFMNLGRCYLATLPWNPCCSSIG